MLKQIAIAAGFVVSLAASIAGGWTAGEWFYEDSDTLSSQAPDLVANSSGPPETTTATNAHRGAGSDAANAPCDDTDPTKPCFQHVPGPLPVLPESAASDHVAQPPDVAAELRKAWQYRTGNANQQAEALAVYRRLADGGNATAQVNLADMYRDGVAVAPAPAEAVSWYQRAAEQGDANGQLRLAAMYLEGRGVAPDYAAARSWLEKAATQGNPTAQARLANMYRDGIGGAPDYPRALALYQQAAQSGNGGAAQAVGAMYMKGLGVEPDDKMAVEWFRRGAEGGHAGSMYSLGLMYQKGRGVEKNAAEALRWLEKAAAGSYARANDAIRLLRQAAAQKSAAPAAPAAAKKSVSTDLQLARRYREGTSAERVGALRIYQRLAEAGNATAQVGLADMYRDGIATHVDAAQAVAWYQQAAQQGDPNGQLRLAAMYFSGPGSTRDYAAARLWFERAAAQGNKAAQLRLARMYRDGLGGAPEYAKAMALYRDAAEHGDGGAAQALGGMYLKGIGVERRRSGGGRLVSARRRERPSPAACTVSPRCTKKAAAWPRTRTRRSDCIGSPPPPAMRAPNRLSGSSKKSCRNGRSCRALSLAASSDNCTEAMDGPAPCSGGGRPTDRRKIADARTGSRLRRQGAVHDL